MNHESLNSIYLPLKVTFGLVPLLAGLDKFFNILTDWGAYLSPQITGMLPINPEVLLGAVGVIEMTVGVAILTRFTRLGAYIAAVWLVLIAANLVFAGILDVAVRDLVMAVGAYSLGQAAALRGEPVLPELRHHEGRVHHAAHS